MSFFGSRSNGTSSPATGGQQGSFFDNLANGAGSEPAPQYLSDPNLAASTQHHRTGSGSPTKPWSASHPPSIWMQRPPPPPGTGAAYSHGTHVAPPPGGQRTATGPHHGFTRSSHPTPPTAASITSSQDGSPTKPLMRPPPGRRTLSHSTLSPSGSVTSMAGAGAAPSAGGGGIASRYALPPTAAALEAKSPLPGAPPPPPAAPANGASDPTSANSPPVPLGARVKNPLQRFAPAASWLVAGASKIGSFVAGADGAQEADESANEPAAAPEDTQAGITSDANSSPPPGARPAQALSPNDGAPPSPPRPHATPPRPPWPRPGLQPPLAATSALSTPPPTENVPEATSTVPLSATPTYTGGSNKSSSGAALAMLADSTAPQQASDANQEPAALFDGSPGPSWLDSTPNQRPEDTKSSPQPLKRFAPAAQWLLAGAGKAAEFVTGVDRGAKVPDGTEADAAAQQLPERAPAGAYSHERSTSAQSESQLPNPAVPSSDGTGAAQLPAGAPAADTSAQEEHYASVSALLAAADTQGSAGSPADQTGVHRGREWGFGSFFMNRQGSRNPSFSANLDASGDATAANGRAPPPPVFTRGRTSAVFGKESPGTASTEKGSTVIHASPRAPSPGRPPVAPVGRAQESDNSAQQLYPSENVPVESEGAGWAEQAPAQGWAEQAPAQGWAQEAPAQGWAEQAPAQGWAEQAPAQGWAGQAPAHGWAEQAPAQGWAQQGPEQGWGPSGDMNMHASMDASAADPVVSSPGNTGWLGGPSTVAAAHDANGAAAGTATDQERGGAENYSGFGAPTNGRPLSPLAVRPRTDEQSASLVGGGAWLGGGHPEVAEAEDVAVDARGDVQFASTPRAAESCSTPFRAGGAEAFGGQSFFEDPAMQLDAAIVEAEAPGSFFGTATTPRAADAAGHAVATGAPPSFFDETTSHTPRAGDACAEVQSFFAQSQHDSTGAQDLQQQVVPEAEDVAIDAYGQVQYASTPTPRTTSGTFFGDYRPAEDPPAPEVDAQNASQYAWSAGANRWGAGGMSSAVATSSDMHAVPGIPTEAEAHAYDPQGSAQLPEDSHGAAPDHQFSALLRNAGLHVRTDADPAPPAVAAAPAYTVYGQPEIQQQPQQQQPDQQAVPGAGFPADSQPWMQSTAGEHEAPAEPQHLTAAAENADAVDSGMHAFSAVASNAAAAPPLPAYDMPPSEPADTHEPEEADGGTMQNERSTVEDGNLAAGDVETRGVGALAGLAGMVGWGRQSHPGEAGDATQSPVQSPVQSPAQSPSPQAQQPPDPAELAPPGSHSKTPPPATAGESLGGFPAAFALFMRDSESEIETKTPEATPNRGTSPDPAQTIENPLWSPLDHNAAAAPPLPSSGLPRPPPPAPTTMHAPSHTSGSLGSAVLPPPPPSLPLHSTAQQKALHGSTAGAFGSAQLPAAAPSDQSLPRDPPAPPMHAMPPTAWPRSHVESDMPSAAQLDAAAALQISSTTGMSSAYAGAESAGALRHDAGGVHATSDAGESPVATSINADSQGPGIGAWSGLQGPMHAASGANDATASGMPFAVDGAEPQHAAAEAPALSAMPAVQAERSSMHGSVESNTPLHERRYSSGTEYSMSKLPEAPAGLSALAPGARPPLVPAPARSTPASSPRARSASASGEKARALQQYVAALESDKYELQRGLKRQMELVRKLADDQQEAENALASSKAEAGELRAELEKTNAALMEKAQIAAAASHTADAAQQAVQDVLDGRTLIVEENVALEEQLLSLKNEAAAAHQQRSELESRVAAAASDVKAVQARADAAAKRAEQDRKRLHDEIEELKEGRATLLGRIKEMALRKNSDSYTAAGAVSLARDSGPSAVSSSGNINLVDAACQCSGAWGDVETARQTLGRSMSHRLSRGGGHSLLPDEAAELQDPVSLRVAEQAREGASGASAAGTAADSQPAAAAGREGEGATGEGGLEDQERLQGWRALLPPVGRGSGVVAAVADTQVGVLDNVHALLDQVAKERLRSKQHIAAKTAEVELLRAAVVAAGGVVPQCGIWHDPTQPDAADAGGSVDPLTGKQAGCASDSVGQASSAAAENGAVRDSAAVGGQNGAHNSVEALPSNGAHHGASGTHAAANGDEIEKMSAAFLVEPGADAQHHTPTKSIEQAGTKGPTGSSTATPSPSRGWFGGMFGRSPSRKSPQPTLLNSA